MVKSKIMKIMYFNSYPYYPMPTILSSQIGTCKALLNYWPVLFRIRHILAKVKPEILHVNSSDGLMYTALPCRTERIPLIWHPRLGLDQFRTHTRIIQRIFVRIKAETPVIGTRVGGIPEIVKDEETGLLVPSHNEKALAQRIIRLLSDENLFHRLVYQALQLVKTQFSVEEHVRKIEQIYTRFSRSESFLEKGGNIKP